MPRLGPVHMYPGIFESAKNERKKERKKEREKERKKERKRESLPKNNKGSSENKTSW